jgi:hypothetical protein
VSQFQPSSPTMLVRYGVASTGASAGGAAAGSAAAAESLDVGGRHVDDTGFLGLNWKSIGAAVVVGTLVAVGTDVMLEVIRPILFKKHR